MIKLVISNVRPTIKHRFIFVCRTEHLDEYGLPEKLQKWAPGCSIITVDQVTEGAACSVLAARHLIDNEDALMIANSDQFIDFDVNRYLEGIYGYDGLIMTMEADDPKWSYVAYDEADPKLVTKVVEKEVISSSATVGVYNFRRGRDFVAAADMMIRFNDRSGGEFYVAPAYNYMISEGQRVTTLGIGSEGHGMYGLGIPSDLKLFLSNPLSLKACAACKS